ncbi:hypothetical protein FRC09_014524, partial [Ceratobasidium sp. 395]
MVTIDELGVILGKRLRLPHLPAHFETVAISFGAFTLVYILSAILSPVLAPKTYPNLSLRTKHSWNVHAVSMAHAVVIGPMALHRLFILPNVGSFEKAFGWEESMGKLHGIAVGYLDKLQMTGGLLQAINGLILLTLFFAVRVCYGIYISFDFFHTLMEVRGTIPAGLVLTYGGGNLALNLLNLF